MRRATTSILALLSAPALAQDFAPDAPFDVLAAPGPDRVIVGQGGVPYVCDLRDTGPVWTLEACRPLVAGGGTPTDPVTDQLDRLANTIEGQHVSDALREVMLDEGCSAAPDDALVYRITAKTLETLGYDAVDPVWLIAEDMPKDIGGADTAEAFDFALVEMDRAFTAALDAAMAASVIARDGETLIANYPECP